jgi:hypothetical protein
MIRVLPSVLAAACLMLAYAPAHGAIILIDFDTLPGGGPLADGSVLTTQYASVGATFSAIENGSPTASWASQDFASDAPNPPNNSGNAWNNFFGAPRADILRVTFATPVSNVQWYTDSEGDPGSPGIKFEAFDSVGTLLETVFVGDTNFPNFLLTSFSVSGISRIDASQPFEDWGWALDNLQFETSDVEVPEPASLVLFAIGACAAGHGALRRRRQQAA